MEFTLNGLTIMKKDGEGNTKYLSQGRWVKICEEKPKMATQPL